MDERKAYIDKREAQRREIAAKIEILKARAAKADAQARITLNRQAERLARQEEKYADKLNVLRQSSSEAFQDLKDGVENAWKELKEGVQKAVEKES